MKDIGVSLTKGTLSSMAVIFDMDGVIFDSERACLDCWMITAKKHQLMDAKKVFYRCIGTNHAQTDAILIESYGEEKVATFRSEYIGEFNERYKDGKLPIKKGAVQILSWLKENHIPVGLASSTREQTVKFQLTSSGLIDYFQMIVGGDRVKISKPNPEIYLMACEKMGVAPERAIAIEDSYNGIRAAKAAGMHPCMVPDLIAPDEEMKETAEVICEDLLVCQKWLEGLL